MPAMRCCLLVLVACSHSPAPSSPAPPSPPVASCNSAEHRQLDFWLGDWNVVVHARATPEGPFADATGHQHVETVLGGCAIAEHFSAAGPQQPWAGKSYSSWQPNAGKWRQTWVDDSGGYLAFTGGVENGEMTLYGEPREVNGKAFQMRMVFKDVTPRALRWEWQRSEDGWKTSAVMMRIDYTRS